MRRGYVVLGWVATAAAATGVGVGAVAVLGDGIVGRPAGPMSQDQVRRELARVPASPPTADPTASPGDSPTLGGTPTPGGTSGTPTPGGTPTASASGPGRVLSSSGGTVVARCLADGRVVLDSWSPRQGFGVEDVARGPAREAEIQFEADDAEMAATVTCVDGEPRARWRAED